jgi:acetyltransferase-like isoleucine patch superfamily enzyme
MINKIAQFYKTLTIADFLRKIIIYLCNILSLSFLKKIKSAFYFKNSGINIGKNLSVYGLCYNISIGKNVTLYDNVIFEFGPQSRLIIGDECLLSYGVLIAVNNQISIGNYVQIGEYTSVRDTTHRYDVIDRPMKFGGDVATPILIGNDVWIGRGCIIQPGTIIEDGVVVGANSVIKGVLRKNGIYAGSPVKFLKMRT